MAVITVPDVTARLVELGVPFAQTELNAIQFSIDKVTNYIKMETNQSDIPAQAYEVAIEMVISDFVENKIAFGLFDPNDVLPPSSPAIKSVKDGDTTITYAVADSPGGDGSYSFSWLISQWRHKDYDWSAWRRLRW